jgi:hypothetical protein
VGKSALPREVHQQSLDYDGAISTLETVDGEPVVVRIYLREEDAARASGAASMIGELRHQVPGRYDSDEFPVASPYPDRAPAHLGGGIFFLNKSTFESAALTTFDGNEYLIVSTRRVRCRSLSRLPTPPTPSSRPGRESPAPAKSPHQVCGMSLLLLTTPLDGAAASAEAFRFVKHE